jgi:hypothetical protein
MIDAITRDQLRIQIYLGRRLIISKAIRIEIIFKGMQRAKFIQQETTMTCKDK